MAVRYKADLNGWQDSDKTLAQWTRLMWKTGKIKIYVMLDGYYVGGSGIASGPFDTYPEAFAEWSSAHPNTQVRDPYIDWREKNPRHAWALETHYPDWCRDVISGKIIAFTEDEMFSLWQAADVLEGLNRKTSVEKEG